MGEETEEKVCQKSGKKYKKITHNMKVFLSQDSRESIKKNYKILTDSLAVLDVPAIAEAAAFDKYKEDPFEGYILMQEIMKKFRSIHNSKRFNSLLYIVDVLDREVIFQLQTYFRENDIFIEKFILVDYEQVFDGKIYKFFSDVI